MAADLTALSAQIRSELTELDARREKLLAVLGSIEALAPGAAAPAADRPQTAPVRPVDPPQRAFRGPKARLLAVLTKAKSSAALAAELRMNQSAVLYHLRSLTDDGTVLREGSGPTVFYRKAPSQAAR